MDFRKFKVTFDTELGVKDIPNTFELELFERTVKYARYISWIPGIEMIAVGNSLSMYATHKDSDIDLFFITKPGYLWFVRVLVTGIFSLLRVWRKGEDIRGNFCLSFFVTTRAMNLETVAIPHDIYLYYWIYYLKPIVICGDTYMEFLHENQWVSIEEPQKEENLKFSTIIGARKEYFDCIWRGLDRCFRILFLSRTLAHNQKLGNPEGVIITDHMLKFHLEDRRQLIRDILLKDNITL